MLMENQLVAVIKKEKIETRPSKLQNIKAGGTLIRKNGRKFRLKIQQNRKSFFYPDKWQQFYQLLSDKNKICFDILIQTGCRINEARYITPADIDEERNVLNVRITKVRAKEGERHPTGRRIPISSEFKSLLLRYAKNNNLKQNDEFPMLTTVRVGQILKENCKSIGMIEWQDMSAHNTRKTFENWLFALGIESFKIASHLGHTLQVASTNYVAPDIFSSNDRILIRRILGDLYLT
jgi:integrase